MVKKVSIWSVLEPLTLSNEPMHLAEISRKLKKNHTTIRKYLSLFEKKGVIIKTKKGRLTIYNLNYSNLMITDYLCVIEKEKLINLCEKELLLKEVVSFIHKHIKNSIVILFGSAVENIKQANDIDTLVIGQIKTIELLKNFENKFNIKFHIINLKRLENANLALKKEIIKKHLIIKGVEESVRWMIEK